MKFNPFEKLTPAIVAAFREKGKRWLVSQTMDLTVSGATGEAKVFLLMSHYGDQGMATVHLKAVKEDRFASLIDLEREVHLKQLEKILEPGSRYVVFSSLIRSRERMEKMASDLYKEKYWRFIQQHAKSGINPNTSVRPSIQLIFGEVYIILKYGAETLRTKLSDIEKM